MNEFAFVVLLSEPLVVTPAGATDALTIAKVNKCRQNNTACFIPSNHRMSNDLNAVSSGAARQCPQLESPFLPSDRGELPKLAPIELPVGARVEFEQQMSNQVVDLPIDRMRTSVRVDALMPSPTCPPTFVYAFKAFCSARRAVSTACIAEGEAMLDSERRELAAHVGKEVGKGGSLPPRSLCISLVIPQSCIHNAVVIPFIDGISALSDMKLNDGTPIATKVRFSIYAGPAEIPMSKVVWREASDRRVVDGVGVVVRWAADEGGTLQHRTECMLLGSTRPLPGEAARALQMAVVKLANSFGFALPGEFFLEPPNSEEGYYEKQIVECSREFHAMLHQEDPFTPSELMVKRQSGVLRRVPGCYARITPIASQLHGVTSPDAIHAILLCGDGMQKKALEYAKTYREGLRPPEGEDELLDLHTAAIQVERLYLNGMVSLYAHGGKSGETLKPDGNWVYRTKAAIVPVKSVMSSFFVMTCCMKSMIPGSRVLLRYMDVHVEKSSRFYNKVFANGDLEGLICRSPSPSTKMTERDIDRLTADERFSLSAMGVDLKSNRMFIGDAISYLTHNGGPCELRQLLIYASTRVGLGASLQEGFASCCSDTKGVRRERDEAQEISVDTAAAAALVMGCNKRARHSAVDTKPEKVPVLMNSFGLKPGGNVARFDDFTARRTADVRRLALAVLEWYGRKPAEKNAHFDEICLVLQKYSDICVAISKAVCVCMAGRRKDAFLILHGHGMKAVSVKRVAPDGSMCPCGIGKVFELDRPCIVVVKMRSAKSCIVTPLIAQ